MNEKLNSQVLIGIHRSRIRKHILEDIVDNIEIESYNDHKENRARYFQMTSAPSMCKSVFQALTNFISRKQLSSLTISFIYGIPQLWNMDRLFIQILK